MVFASDLSIPEKEELILKLLGEKNGLDRPTLVKLTGLSRSTLFDTLDRLIRKNQIIKYPASEIISKNKPGRPKVIFEKNPLISNEQCS